METRRQSKIARRIVDDDSLEEKKTGNISSKEIEHTYSNVGLTFDVLTIIFKELCAKDLLSAALVCRSWNEVADNEKRKRGFSVFFIDLHKSWPALWPNKQLIDRIKCKPMFGFMFSRRFDRMHPVYNEKKNGCTCRRLPSNCPYIIIGNNGVIMDRTELEENPVKASCMFFPYDKEVSIETICYPMALNNKRWCNTNIECRSEKVLLEYSMAIKKAKCVILLTREDYHHPHLILERIPKNPDCALWGGVASDLSICRRNKYGNLFCTLKVSWIALLISGKNVRSWSVVVTSDCDTKDKIEAKLEKLKSQVLLRKHSMGFMFACTGRGEYMLHEKNVESTIFKKLFPLVPLVGSFGGGEYGVNTMGRIGRQSHQYSTVFMILTYG